MRILVLSTDNRILDVFKRLESIRLSVSSCGSVMSATVLVEETNPRLIFIDVRIHGAQDFALWLRKTSASQTVAIVSGTGQSGSNESAFDAQTVLPLTERDIMITCENMGICVDDESSQDSEEDVFWSFSQDLRGILSDETNDRPSDTELSGHEIRHSDAKIISQEVVAVWGAKGGAGRTTVALAISNYLSDFDVLLIDLNFKEGPGDINALLDLPPSPHIGSLLEAKSDRRRGFMEALVKPRRGSFAVVQPPPTIDQAEQVSPDDVVELIDQARRCFQIIVIDLPPDLSPVTLEAVDMATSIVFVSDGHLGGLARIESLKSFVRKDIHKSLIVNRCRDSRRKAKEIAHLLDLPLAARIPVLEINERAENSGKILTVCDSIMTEGVEQISRMIFGLTKPAKTSELKLIGQFRAAISNIIG